jgi:RimJ/RimL family protein N-acetyltransferase
MIFAETERLILRRAREEDLDALLPSWSDPEMTRYTEVKADAGTFLRRMIADMQVEQPGDSDPGGPWYQFIVERRSDCRIIGDLGAGFGMPGERQVELGYRIHSDHQRQGFTREAVGALVGCLVAEHEIHRFIAVVASANAASISVLRSLGFRQEGHFQAELPLPRRMDR